MSTRLCQLLAIASLALACSEPGELPLERDRPDALPRDLSPLDTGRPDAAADAGGDLDADEGDLPDEADGDAGTVDLDTDELDTDELDIDADEVDADIGALDVFDTFGGNTDTTDTMSPEP